MELKTNVINEMKLYNYIGKKTLQNKEIPLSSGVYFVWSKKELIYIGKANELRKRIAQHFGNGIMVVHMFDPDEANKISIIETENVSDAEKLEEQFLDLIFPKYNKFPFYKNTTGVYLHANPIKAIEGAREIF